jgi:hypothetical protein
MHASSSLPAAIRRRARSSKRAARRFSSVCFTPFASELAQALCQQVRM